MSNKGHQKPPIFKKKFTVTCYIFCVFVLLLFFKENNAQRTISLRINVKIDNQSIFFMLVLLVENIFLTTFFWIYISNLINILFSLKSSRPCWDLNPGPPRYQANMLPTELSWLGLITRVRKYMPPFKNVLIMINLIKCNQLAKIEEQKKVNWQARVAQLVACRLVVPEIRVQTPSWDKLFWTNFLKRKPYCWLSHVL